MKKQLENPVWSALSETHKELAVDYKFSKFYNPEVCNFGAFPISEKTVLILDDYAKRANEFYLVSKEAPLFNNKKVAFAGEVLCDQMILKKIKTSSYKDEIIKLNESHIKEIYDLIWLVMPGYYRERTFTLGNYYGIFKEGKLVALTGERLQSNLFIEISGVVTHPKYTRRGFAKQLVRYTTENVLKQNKLPILHVAEKNTNAIKLYEKLGYEKLQKITWRKFMFKE